MRKIFSDNAWEDYLYWQKHDKKILKKINNLIKVRIYNLIGRLSIKNRTLCELEKVIINKNLEWKINSN